MPLTGWWLKFLPHFLKWAHEKFRNFVSRVGVNMARKSFFQRDKTGLYIFYNKLTLSWLLKSPKCAIIFCHIKIKKFVYSNTSMTSVPNLEPFLAFASITHFEMNLLVFPLPFNFSCASIYHVYSEVLHTFCIHTLRNFKFKVVK